MSKSVQKSQAKILTGTHYYMCVNCCIQTCVCTCTYKGPGPVLICKQSVLPSPFSVKEKNILNHSESIP